MNIIDYFKFTIDNLSREYWYNSLSNLLISDKNTCITKDNSTSDNSFRERLIFKKSDLKPNFKGKLNIGDIVKLNIKRYGYVELVIYKIPALDIRNKYFKFNDIISFGGSYIVLGIQKVKDKYLVIESGDSGYSVYHEDSREENLELLKESSDLFINLIQKLIKDNNRDEINLILDYLWDEYEFDLSKVDLSKEEWKTYYKEEEE